MRVRYQDATWYGSKTREMFWRWLKRSDVSWRACALRLCKLLSTVKTLLFLTRDFLCLVQGSEIYRDVKRANWVWIRDIFIEFTERFLSGYATSSSLNFFVKKKNFACRIVSGAKKYDHVTPLLKSLPWLPVKDQLFYRQAIMAFKCMSGLAWISYIPIYYPRTR